MSMADQENELTPLMEGAYSMHELYLSYRAAGFGRYESLWLIGCLMKGVPIPSWLEDRLRNAEPED